MGDLGPSEGSSFDPNEPPPLEPFYEPPATPDDLALAVPDLAPGTHPAEHEADILYVANRAMEQGVRTVTEFARWFEDMTRNAQRSGAMRAPPRHAPPPTIQALAGHLRRTEAMANNDLDTRSRPGPWHGQILR